MVTTINILGGLVLIGLPLYGLRRGSVPLFCSGFYLIIFGVLANLVSAPLAAWFPLTVPDKSNFSQGVWMLAMLLPLCVLAFPLGHRLHQRFRFKSDATDRVLGVLFGAVLAFVMVRILLTAVLLAAQPHSDYVALTRSFLVTQLVDLDGWHAMLAWLHRG